MTSLDVDEPEPASPVGTAVGDAGAAPCRAAGLALLGEVAGSGYRSTPCLVRRADGQTLQLTPVLYAVLEAIDGRRDAAAIARHLEVAHGLVVAPEDVAHLLEQKLQPLGVLRGADGSEPAVRRTDPLLALRGRVAVSSPARTDRIAAPFTGLFRVPVVVAVLAAFVAVSGWLLLDEGLASGARQALYEPQLLLLVFSLTVLSAGFHELGHAAACRYGGASPGVMGAGIYLVWPAFYTDVSDSYRLDRRGRLRVDLGGLYFNAVFAVGTFVLWWVSGWDALLVVIPIQLLQMLRQLIPLVRFDGYHILADLTGVPDLFARIKPVLLGMLPSRWGSAEARVLRPWARAVVTGWVVVVVPVLGVSLVLMAVALPRLAATAWDSLGLQWTSLVDSWAQGALARMALGVLSLLAIAVPILAISYLLIRVVRRAARGLWSAAGDDPRRRAGVVALAAAVGIALAAAWWPDGQYEPLDVDDRGTLTEAVRAVRTTGFGSITGASLEPGPAGAADVSAPATADDERGTFRAGAGLVARDSTPADDDLGRASASTAWPARRSFVPPDSPGPADNQALAINYDDGSTLVDTSPSLVWADGSQPVTSSNEAWALASCHDCTTMAVAFQVVLVVDPQRAVAPQNQAVAVNAGCVACRTRALAMQTVLTLRAAPGAEQVERIDALWARAEAVLDAAGPASFTETRARLAAIEGELLAVLGDLASGAPDHDVDADDSADEGSDDGDGTVGSTADDSNTSDEPDETGATDDSHQIDDTVAAEDATSDGTSPTDGDGSGSPADDGGGGGEGTSTSTTIGDTTTSDPTATTDDAGAEP